MAMSDKVRNALERAIVRALIDELGKAGYEPRAVWDGAEYTHVEGADAAVAAVFAVDESTLHFCPVGQRLNWGSTGVLLIGGNGEDIISDWHAGPPAFADAVQRACDRIQALAVVV